MRRASTLLLASSLVALSAGILPTAVAKGTDQSVTMQPEPTYDVRAYDTLVKGHANCAEFLQGHFDSLPGIHTKATRFYHDDEAVIVEVAVEGTHTGEIAGIPANGNAINVDSIGIFYFEPDGDIILGEQVWADMLKLTQQLTGEQPASTG